MAGPVAEAVSRGVLATPVVMTTHGGRARAIESGELHIDVAFIAAPAADRHGNLSGAEGRAACGPLGYAMVDAAIRRPRGRVTDQLWPQPPCPDRHRAGSGRLRRRRRFDRRPARASCRARRGRPPKPVGLQIAQTAAQVIAASGLLATASRCRPAPAASRSRRRCTCKQAMRERGVQGSFGAGGVTGTLVDMLEAGLFRNIYDVQCFDLRPCSRTATIRAIWRCRRRCTPTRTRAGRWSSGSMRCCSAPPRSTWTSTSTSPPAATA